MKNKNRIIMLCLAALTACALTLTGCSGELSGGSLPEDGFTPAVDDGAESQLYARYEQYSADIAEAFVNTPAAHADCFVLEQVEGGVKIVDYVSDSKVVRIPGQLSDGTSVVAIGEGAFADKNVRAIYVPDTVEDVEAGAFLNCEGLITLRLPWLFGDFLGYVFGASAYGGNAISVPTSLDKLILGEMVQEIKSNAFSGCKSLSAVKLPDTVKEIGSFAFYDCADLVYVDLGGAESIGSYAFAECRELYAADCSSVDKIGLGAFYNCPSLNSISLMTLGDSENAYLGYIFGAESIEYSSSFVPKSLRTVYVSGECGAIGAKAFAGCEYITAIELGEGIESIGVRAFYSCRSLGAIELPDTVTSLGDDAFFGCDGLKSVKPSSGLTAIGMQTFFGCSSLESIELPMSVTEIGASAFYGCSSLKTVSLGGVKKIGKDAFAGCASLDPVNIDGIEVAEGNGALTTADGTK